MSLQRSLSFSSLIAVAFVATIAATHEQDPTPRSQPVPLTVPAGGRIPVAIVLGRRAEVLDFAGPLEVFAAAYTAAGEPAFAPYTVAASKEPLVVGANLRIVPDHDFASAPPPKIIVIPAMSDAAATPAMIDWIRTASKTTDVTMSVCNGAFVLARTGLLAGKPATLHHGGFFRFAATFPDVQLRRGARFVEAGNLASAGGVSSGTDLALHVVARYLGRDAAVELADAIEYQGKGWLDPDSNTSYATLPPPDEHNPRCPLCQMEADRSLSTTHKGVTYWFCAASEKQFFDAHLEVIDRFLAEDAARTRAGR